MSIFNSLRIDLRALMFVVASGLVDWVLRIVKLAHGALHLSAAIRLFTVAVKTAELCCRAIEPWLPWRRRFVLDRVCCALYVAKSCVRCLLHAWLLQFALNAFGLVVIWWTVTVLRVGRVPAHERGGGLRMFGVLFIRLSLVR